MSGPDNFPEQVSPDDSGDHRDDWTDDAIAKGLRASRDNAEHGLPERIYPGGHPDAVEPADPTGALGRAAS